MFIGHGRGCNQMVSDADTLLLYITPLISWPRGTVLIFLSSEVETTNSPYAPTACPLKGSFVSVQGCEQTLIALYFTFPRLLQLEGDDSGGGKVNREGAGGGGGGKLGEETRQKWGAAAFEHN